MGFAISWVASSHATVLVAAQLLKKGLSLSSSRILWRINSRIRRKQDSKSAVPGGRFSA